MEEPQKKIQRATHVRSQADTISLDLIPEILSRLPTKSIVRYRSVCKLWSSFTTLLSFINSFVVRSSARRPSLLLTFSAKAKRFVFFIPQNQNPDGSYSPLDSYQMINTSEWNFPRSESVHGLGLLSRLVIWNPTLRQFLTLTEPKETYGKIYLGYDPLEGKHKVLRIDYEPSEQPWVVTLGAQESWKIITDAIPRHHPAEKGARCFNGILYYHAFLGFGYERCIMSFDVRSEKFNPIKYPEDKYRYNMIPYERRLALVSPYFYADRKIDLYILKDADGHEWTHKRFLVPSNRDKTQGRTYLQFQGVTDAGELIITPSSFSNSFYVLYYDPRRNSVREAWFERIDGLDRCYNLDIFPNHIENLVSF